jgi:transcription termination factor NusB
MTVAIDEARRIAVLVLHDVLETGAFANLSSIRLLENRKLSARDRAFASALIYGTISRLVSLDYLLEKVSNKPLAKLQPLTRTILRLGAWQLYYSTSVPPAAAVDESVKLAHQLENPGSAAFVNACLRRLAEPDRPQIPASKPALTVGLPPELFGYLKKWYGLTEAITLGEAALEAWSVLSRGFATPARRPFDPQPETVAGRLDHGPGRGCDASRTDRQSPARRASYRFMRCSRWQNNPSGRTDG